MTLPAAGGIMRPAGAFDAAHRRETAGLGSAPVARRFAAVAAALLLR
ncbi:hypothetical protein [Bradyrhizobium sp. SZCCHNR1051]|nr:hypothetical protein [Bradyrhizobium sp. SZCCHNR1051]